MRNLTAAIMASRTKTAKTMSWVMANGGSVCVGASAFNAGTFSKLCTTPTKTFKYRATIALIT